MPFSFPKLQILSWGWGRVVVNKRGDLITAGSHLWLWERKPPLWSHPWTQASYPEHLNMLALAFHHIHESHRLGCRIKEYLDFFYLKNRLCFP